MVPVNWCIRYAIPKGAIHRVAHANGCRVAAVAAALPGFQLISVWIERMTDNPWIVQWEPIQWNHSSDNESGEPANPFGMDATGEEWNRHGRNATLRGLFTKILPRFLAALVPHPATFSLVTILTIVEAVACTITKVRLSAATLVQKASRVEPTDPEKDENESSNVQ